MYGNHPGGHMNVIKIMLIINSTHYAQETFS
jgi:hypothetical protein